MIKPETPQEKQLIRLIREEKPTEWSPFFIAEMDKGTIRPWIAQIILGIREQYKALFDNALPPEESVTNTPQRVLATLETGEQITAAPHILEVRSRGDGIIIYDPETKIALGSSVNGLKETKGSAETILKRSLDIFPHKRFDSNLQVTVASWTPYPDIEGELNISKIILNGLIRYVSGFFHQRQVTWILQDRSRVSNINLQIDTTTGIVSCIENE